MLNKVKDINIYLTDQHIKVIFIEDLNKVKEYTNGQMDKYMLVNG